MFTSVRHGRGGRTLPLMPATAPHHCDETCVCPIHDTPLIYAPRLDDHACQDPGCVLGGGTAPVFFNVNSRHYLLQAARPVLP